MLKFVWRMSKGHRLAPWNSPYLRWRIETYWGLHAGKMTGAQCRRFLWEHRRELLRFLRWASEMERLTRQGPAFTAGSTGAWIRQGRPPVSL
jgi:hypothetical protein